MKEKWHKLSDYDYPPPYKKVLIFMDDRTQYHIGWYEGEARKLQWHICQLMDVSSRHIVAWCELPNIPSDFTEIRG